MALNVLVVDDSAVMRAMLLKTLRLSRIPLGEVYQAGDGAAGLEAACSHWIDLVLLDISMPVMRGDEVLQRLRADPATEDLPVIVVSSEPARERIAAMGDARLDFVQKPFTPEQIRDTIVRMTGVTDDELDRDVAGPDRGLDF